jgi:hypothetical protein
MDVGLMTALEERGKKRKEKGFDTVYQVRIVFGDLKH